MTSTFRKLSIASLLSLLLFFVPLAIPHTYAQSDTGAPDVSEAVQVDGAKPGFFTSIGTNLLKGIKAVGRTVSGWFSAIGKLLGLGAGGLEQGEACESTTQCGKDLLCLNTCNDEECDRYEKHCVPGSADVVVEFKSTGRLVIKPEFAECGAEDLCAKDLTCTRTCPVGVDCSTTHRCLQRDTGLGSCTVDFDCRSICSKQPFAPIGVSAYRPSCEAGACNCRIQEVNPELNITACTSKAESVPIICPSGTHAACTKENCTGPNCEARLTCLTAPQFGGQCLSDDSCSNVACAEGTNPFCDTDRKCRCKKQEAVTVTCQQDAECSGISCPSGQISACFGGVCTCGTKVQQEQETSCTTANECPDTCTEGFSRACVNNQCACTRTTENVPVSCSTVAECGGVTCPDDFEKVCLNNQCACTRTTTQ